MGKIFIEVINFMRNCEQLLQEYNQGKLDFSSVTDEELEMIEKTVREYSSTE